MEAHGDISGFLRALGEFHRLLTRTCHEILIGHDVGDDVALTHSIFLKHCDGSVAVSSEHRFSISLGLDFRESNEVVVQGAVCIFDEVSIGSISLSVNLDRAVDNLKDGSSIVSERHFETSDPIRAVLWLQDAAAGLPLAETLSRVGTR
ncbi:hypothetical protein ABIA35_000004 [Catenulispora sp. MAP12-49]|uniref:hypothetical protein n=1 Tax=unclassified Catenulispora TaxID=414885 RepID=UPI003517FA2C